MNPLRERKDISLRGTYSCQRGTRGYFERYGVVIRAQHCRITPSGTPKGLLESLWGVKRGIRGDFGLKRALFDASKALFSSQRTQSNLRRPPESMHTRVTTRVAHAVASPSSATVRPRRPHNLTDPVIIDVPRVVHHVFMMRSWVDLPLKTAVFACFAGLDPYDQPLGIPEAV